MKRSFEKMEEDKKNKKNQYVYAVFYNADMIEGKGPLVLDCIFSELLNAENYIDSKEGVMGSSRKWSREKPLHDNLDEKGSYKVCGTDWQIWAYLLFKDSDDVNRIEREANKQRALSKLTNEEKKTLGF